MNNMNNDMPLFRYFNLPSFLFLMGSRCLHFEQITKWPDKFEGSSYKLSSNIFFNELTLPCESIWGNCWTQEVDVKECHADEASFIRANMELYKNGSAAMWGSYCVECGVRVKSTVGKVELAIAKFLDKADVDFEHGPVEYVPDLVIKEEPRRALFHKRIPFRYESEYRFLVADKTGKRTSVEVPIGDPFDFFDEMLVSPTTDSNGWITDMIYQSIASSVGLEGSTKKGKQFARKSQLYSCTSQNIKSSCLRFNTVSEYLQEFKTIS